MQQHEVEILTLVEFALVFTITQRITTSQVWSVSETGHNLLTYTIKNAKSVHLDHISDHLKGRYPCLPCFCLAFI